MTDIALNLTAIRERIGAACLRVGRDAASVELVAVTKTFPAEAVREAEAKARVAADQAAPDLDGEPVTNVTKALDD